MRAAALSAANGRSIDRTEVSSPTREEISVEDLCADTTCSIYSLHSTDKNNNGKGNEDTNATNTSPKNKAHHDAGKRPQSLAAFHQQRYGLFLHAYFGYMEEQRARCVRQATQMCMIGIGNVKRNNGDAVHVLRSFLRHSVLAVEGDAVFVKLVQRAKLLRETRRRYHQQQQQQQQQNLCPNVSCPVVDDAFFCEDDPRYWPNARCIALHYGLPAGSVHDAAKFPPASLMSILASTRITEGEEVRLCLHSYQRCLDEATWYEQMYCVTPEDGEDDECNGSVARGWKRFHKWPEGLSFYHGVGARHAGVVPAAAFPFTLLNLTQAVEIGPDHKGLYAAKPIPYGTCFLYGGPAIATKVVEELHRKGRTSNHAGGSTTRTITSTAHTTTAASTVGSVNIVSATQKGEGSGEAILERHGNGLALGTDHVAYGVPTDDVCVDDDTYALGLGSHGVCFGQGLMRYANHRYNLSRFGNVELCSVMLSVKSEFSALAKELENHRNRRCRRRRRPVKREQHVSHPQQGGECNHVQSNNGQPSIHTAKDMWKGNLIATDGKRKGHTVKPKKRRPLLSRRLFLEEYSHFVTIPFFIATTDINVGEQLLAWTYGDEYDARLERLVVCDGHLVPYADAAVLNARLPLERRQRYTGDYRGAMNVGDIVWCRRSSLHESKQGVKDSRSDIISLNNVEPTEGESVYDVTKDLFVIVETIRSAECLLLRPLARSCIPHDSREAILATFCSTDSAQTSTSEEDALLLFDICEAKGLERCVIAPFGAVALLLVDHDYWLAGSKLSQGSRSTTLSRCGLCGMDSSALTATPSCSPHRVAIQVDTLREVTRLAMTSTTRVPTLLNGYVWPLLRARYQRMGKSKESRRDGTNASLKKKNNTTAKTKKVVETMANGVFSA